MLAVISPASAQEAAPPPPPLRRWFEIDFAQLGTRYRMIETSDRRVTNNHVQHREQFRARLKADARGRYVLNAGVFTGASFISGWNNTGLGTGEPVTNLRLKQLFLSAMPVDGLQAQVGSLYVVRGESTEITTYDEDAFIVGERVHVTRPAVAWFDEIAFTNAELAHVNQPSVHHRWDGLSQPNYRQLLVRKQFGRVAASADFTSLRGARTVRGAAAVTVPPGTVRLEAYRRMRELPAGGFAVTLERPLTTWLRASGGYASVDLDYGGLNADRFDRGRRLFGTTTLTFTRWLNLSLFATRAFASDVVLSNRTRFDAVLSYNLLDTLRRTGVF